MVSLAFHLLIRFVPTFFVISFFLLLFRSHGPGVASAPHPELVLLVSSSLRAIRGRRERLVLCVCRRYPDASYFHVFVVRRPCLLHTRLPHFIPS